MLRFAIVCESERRGSVFALSDELLRDLGMAIGCPEQIPPEYRLLVAAATLGGSRGDPGSR